MYKKPPPPKPEPTLKQAFMQLLRRNKTDAAFFRVRTEMAWEKLFGKHVREHTTKLMIRNRRLYVYVDNAPLRHQLTTLRAQMLRRLNEEFEEEYLEEILIR